MVQSISTSREAARRNLRCGRDELCSLQVRRGGTGDFSAFGVEID
jgi:hypothetical protein